MNRRAFLASVAILATQAYPARSQQTAVPTIGFLGATNPDNYSTFVNGLIAGLKESGFTEPQTLHIEYRWADGHYDQLPQLASELASQEVSVIVATGGLQSSLAAKAATGTIPIVFTLGSDPVKFGVVQSLNRPGGNVTGVSLVAYQLDAKRVELLNEVAPAVQTVALLLNPNNPAQADAQRREVENAARKFGKQFVLLSANSRADLERAMAELAQRRNCGLLVSADPLFLSERDLLINDTKRHAIPAIFEWRKVVEDGGLISYGIDLVDAYRQAGMYVGRILKGAKPADLPVLQVTKFELVINMKTAKALGLNPSAALLTSAHDVIE